VRRAGLDRNDLTPFTMHSCRDTFASHVIIDLGLDVVQVSRQLGHANPAITAKTYARMFDQTRQRAQSGRQWRQVHLEPF
jgi:integrase